MNSHARMGGRSLQKVGLIGDVHAESEILAAVLAFLNDAMAVDCILCCGDLVDGPGSVDDCVNQLEQSHVLTVRGNHDHWFSTRVMRDLADATQSTQVSIKTQTYIDNLPPMLEIQTAGGLAMVCHGIGVHDMRSVKPDDYGYGLSVNDELWSVVYSGRYRFMLSGHTHQAMVRTFKGLTVINAGALKANHSPGFQVVDFVNGVVEVYAISAERKISKQKDILLADIKIETLP